MHIKVYYRIKIENEKSTHFLNDANLKRVFEVNVLP